MSNVWGRGSAKLVMNSNQVPWEDDVDTLKAMNMAFEIYYIGSQAGIYDRKISDSVWDSFTDGRGSTVADDLQETFQYLVRRLHLAHNETSSEFWWGDMYRKKYSGKLFPNSVLVPKGIWEFLTSVEGKMGEVAVAFAQWGDQFAQVESQYEEQDWENLGRTIGSVNKAAGCVKPHLWLAPTSVKSRAGSAISFVSVTAELHSAATAFADGNLEEWTKQRLAVEVLGKLPILGQFYGAALESFPSIVEGYTARVQCRVQMIDNFALGRDFRECRKTNIWY